MEGKAILDELRRVDETTLIFNPWGIGGRLAPESSALFLSQLLSRATLTEDVPEDVRLNFERVRLLFQYGLLEYEFFSAAFDLAHLVLEGALRHRFVTYYNHEVPIRRDGSAESIAAPTFDLYYDSLTTLRRTSRQLRLREKRPEGLPRSLPDLFLWARRRGLLIGQRNVGIFGSITRLRNYVAHPERYSRGTPVDAIHLLQDVAEIINRLWGHDTEGGRLFPTPVARRPRAAALSPERTAAVTFGSLPLVPLERDKSDWAYALFLAAETEELIDFDWEQPGHQRFAHTPGFQLTQYPVELLWGPGSLDELVGYLQELDEAQMSDTVNFLDRDFFIRIAAEVELPRSAVDVTTFDGSDQTARWEVVRADYPLDALAFVKAREATPDGEFLGASKVTQLTGDGAARRYARRQVNTRRY